MDDGYLEATNECGWDSDPCKFGRRPAHAAAPIIDGPTRAHGLDVSSKGQRDLGQRNARSNLWPSRGDVSAASRLARRHICKRPRQTGRPRPLTLQYPGRPPSGIFCEIGLFPRKLRPSITSRRQNTLMSKYLDKEGSHQRRDLRRMRLEGEMTGIEQMHLCGRQVATIRCQWTPAPD